MWITKLKLMHKDCHIVPRCQKFNVTSYAYPTGAYTKKGHKYVTGIHFLQGEENNKKAFFRDLKKDKRVKRIEISGNIYSYEVDLGRQGEHVQLYYNPQIFFVKPVINSPEGFEYWEVTSWNRTILEKFIQTLEKHMDYCKVLKIEETKKLDIYFPLTFPQLPTKQKEAIEFAYKRRYYSYPKKITIKNLAKEAKVSVPTFQEHLRKAEIKLLPFIMEQRA